ncbi:MAG: hypothetical protein IMF18_11835, partial [Proteobacteria bacterium]|nr:hypothetical protein [Pseudomonadota bacterium]
TIAENNESLRRIIDAAKENVVEGKIVHGMVDRNALVYYELLLKTVPKMSYDITSTMFGLQVHPIDYYVTNGFDYFIISENMKRSRTTDLIERGNPYVARFYSSLDQNVRLCLIKVIEPGCFNRGDTFYIYRLNRNNY